MDTHTTPQDKIFVPPHGGTHLEFLNNLATVKVAGGDSGALSVVEFLGPKGFGPPLHRHNFEDELFVILEGQVRLFTGGEEILAETGSVAMLPRAVPHTFQIITDSARILNVTGSVNGAPQFDRMVTKLGVATNSLAIPAPMEIDPGLVAEVCAEFGIDIVGPPPAPLE